MTTSHPLAQGLAVILGLCGSVLGLAGFVAALSGDGFVPVGPALYVAGGLAAVALAGTIAASVAPGCGAAAMGLACLGYLVTIGPRFAAWYAGLLAATAAGPLSENAYWAAAPAVALFACSGMVLVLATLLALVASGSHANGAHRAGW